jgi:hypothetical protein
MDKLLLNVLRAISYVPFAYGIVIDRRARWHAYTMREYMTVAFQIGI